MIPKVIHYCWFGRGQMPELALKCIESWHKYLPGYTMKLWNEDSFDINSVPYVKEAYEARKFAFVTDYIRLYALYHEGGIYMDTDMKPLKPFDHLLEENAPFIGMRSTKSFATGVIGAPKKHPAVKHLIDKLPERYSTHGNSSVVFGPGYVSAEWFGRKDIRHLPVKTFYLYDGFKAPKREERDRLMEEGDFPEEMLAVHYGNHVWGGKPKRKTYENRNDI